MQAKISADRSALGLTNVMQIKVSVNDRAELGRAREEVSELLRERHRSSEDDFSILSQEELLKTMDDIKRGLMVFMGTIAGIALLVGGIGIMNIMLVSVTERTREVGIRKALGARRGDILMQFLAEAVMVTLVGGVIGVGLGVLGAAFADGKPLMGGNLVTVVTTQSIIITVGSPLPSASSSASTRPCAPRASNPSTRSGMSERPHIHGRSMAARRTHSREFDCGMSRFVRRS